MSDFEFAALRKFSQDDQQRFAALSGDCNPMHMDAIAARRTQAGQPAVHGINALLWALEQLAARDTERAFARIACKFLRFVGVGMEVALWIKPGPAATRMELRGGATKLVSIVVHHTPGAARGVDVPAPAGAPPAWQASPAELSFEQAEQAHGAIPLRLDGATYPRLAERIGQGAVGALAALSYLVGMVVPGLHSVFSSLDVDLAPNVPPGDRIAYRVTEAHDVFRRVTIAVAGSGIAGEVNAFLRPAPVAQPTMAELGRLVAPGAYAHVNALVVGGSRGLGNVVAKLLACGGARVAISYLVGEADARAAADEIKAYDGHCDVLHIDAAQPMAPQLAGLPFAPNQVYYFATTRIFLDKAELFSPAVLATFARVYVDGFASLCAALSAAAAENVLVFYPSSVAVGERPQGMTEYAMAKAAGEVLCADITRFMPQITTLMRRLPRLLTDQTATVTPVPTPDATDVMREIVEAMAAAAR